MSLQPFPHTSWRGAGRNASERRPLSALLSLVCVTLLTAALATGPVLAAEQTEDWTTGEITYQGRTGQELPQTEPAASVPEETPTPPEEMPIALTPDELQTTLTLEEPADWNLVLINRDSPLPKEFTPPELTDIGGGQRVDSRIAESLERMLADARREGLHPIVCSAYRTQSKQTQLYERKVRYYQALGYQRTRAEEKAAFWVARPDTSEHQAGLAVDIISTEYQILNDQQEKTAVQQWLMSHCAEYGFILRYPTDKSGLTGVGYEPWHYRYVGETAAREITDQGVCLEEYLAK